MKLSDQCALTIVYAAKGYPDAPERGSIIGNLDAASLMPNVIITHAGTKKDGLDLIANGGRVLNITGLGHTVAQARDAAYAAIEKISWPGGFYRRDIGWRALARD